LKAAYRQAGAKLEVYCRLLYRTDKCEAYSLAFASLIVVEKYILILPQSG